jgi:hypothetical protein
MAILYIFVDESGNPSRDDYYVVTGCWCVSDERNSRTVLDPTVQRLMNIAEGVLRSTDTVSELKGASLPTEVLTAVIESIDEVWYDDSTIPHTALPWETAYPARFSIAQSNPQATQEAISGLLGNQLDAPKTLKLMLLISILDPLFRPELIEYGEIDSIEVVLDADVWKAPAAYASDAFDEVGEVPVEVSFATGSSEKTPGLQLADLGAYSWARHHRKGDCRSVIKTIDRYRFAAV